MQILRRLAINKGSARIWIGVGWSTTLALAYPWILMGVLGGRRASHEQDNGQNVTPTVILIQVEEKLSQ
jgi:hypothetical protein